MNRGVVTLISIGAVTALTLTLMSVFKRPPDYYAPVVVAVLDSGIDKDAPGLASIIGEVNFTDSPTLEDVRNHGTFVASIISRSNKEKRKTGNECYLLNVKVADDTGHTLTTQISDGIHWAVEHGANIINISLCVYDYSHQLEEAVDYAWENGVVVIGAAGNEGDDLPAYPGCYPNCIGVTGLDENGNLLFWSNYGDCINAAALGVFDSRRGTSYAAAYVSNFAAQLFNAEGTAPALRQELCELFQYNK